MIMTLQRAALYSVFDAIEQDLVAFIRQNICNRLPNVLSPDEVEKAKKNLAKRNKGDVYDITSHFDLLYGIDLSEKCDVILRNDTFLNDFDQRYFRELKHKLASLVSVRNDTMHGRPLTTEDYSLGFALADDLVKAPAFWPALVEAVHINQEYPEVLLKKRFEFFEDGVSAETTHNLPVPDYEDTGFVPRRVLEKELKQKITGRYPVVTILGEGGAGKSALALQTAYGLVKTNDHDFDAIIWFSAKSAFLNVNEIKRIDASISSSLDLFEEAADSLEPGEGDPLVRLRKLLQENKILLIIDNLETILDGSLTEFAKDIPGQSKLVITSRVPIGVDLTVNVGGFSETEAITYLRQLIQSFSIRSLQGLSNTKLLYYCEKLHRLPLLIKWFALGVRSGLDPDKIVNNTELAVEYCFENVFESLIDSAKQVAFALAILPGSQSPSVVREVTDISAEDIEEALVVLKSYGLIGKISQNTYDGELSLQPLAKQFILNKKHTYLPVEEVMRRYKRLGGLMQMERGNKQFNRYIMGHYTIRSQQEAVSVQHLRQAIKLANSDDLASADKIIAEQKIIIPGYFEVYRVAAHIAYLKGDVSTLQMMYQKAIETDSKQPQLYYWYGGALMRYFNDFDAAIEQFKKALELDPNDSTVNTEIARAYMFISDFERASEHLKNAQAVKRPSTKSATIIADLEAQLIRRKADQCFSAGDYIQGIKNLVGLAHYVDSLDPTLIDSTFVEHIKKSRQNIESVAQKIGTNHDLLFYKSWYEKFMKSYGAGLKSAQIHEDGTVTARLKIQGRREDYAFFSCGTLGEIYVSKKNVGEEAWAHLQANKQARFKISEKPNGRVEAINVTIED